MKRKRITSVHGFIEAGGVARNGATTHGAGIGLHHYPVDKVALALTDLIVKHGDVEGAKEDVNAALVTLEEKERTAQRLVMVGRDGLKDTFGYVHSDTWSMVGLPVSLEVPRRASKLIPVMETMRIFYTNHPDLEIAPRNVTAVKIGEALEALKTAKAALTAQRTTLRTLRAERRVLCQNMQRTLTGLADEVTELIGPDDYRHLDFGFNIPGAEETPDVPQNVTLVLSGPGVAAISWDAAARTARYRVWKRVVGVDTAWIAVGSTSDLDMTIRELPANTRVEIAVSAVNSGGESQKSTLLAFNTP